MTQNDYVKTIFELDEHCEGIRSYVSCDVEPIIKIELKIPSGLNSTFVNDQKILLSNLSSNKEYTSQSWIQVFDLKSCFISQFQGHLNAIEFCQNEMILYRWHGPCLLNGGQRTLFLIKFLLNQKNP